jgi:hypothetical protein
MHKRRHLIGLFALLAALFLLLILSAVVGNMPQTDTTSISLEPDRASQ